MSVDSQGSKTDALLVTSETDHHISMETCFLFSHTHAQHKKKHTHTRACWRLQMGRETDLPSTGRKRMEEEGEKERKKEKPGVILASKRKRQKVRSVSGGLWGFVCTRALQTITVN